MTTSCLLAWAAVLLLLDEQPRHGYDLITEIGYDAQSFSGIGYMQIEFDFIVAPPPT